MKTYSSYEEFLCEQLAKWWDDYFWDCPDSLKTNPWRANSTVRRFAMIKAEHIHKALLKQPGISPAQAHVLMLSGKFFETYGRIMSALSSFTGDSSALPPAFIQDTFMQRCKEIIQLLSDACKNDPEIIERTQKELIEMGISQVPPPNVGGGVGCGAAGVSFMLVFVIPLLIRNFTR